MTVPQRHKMSFLVCKRSLYFYLKTHKRRLLLEVALLLLCILLCLFSCTLRGCALCVFVSLSASSVLKRYILSCILANDSFYKSKSPWPPAGWINVIFLKTVAFHENNLRRTVTVSAICPRKHFGNLIF